jgi:hypothetical protein
VWDVGDRHCPDPPGQRGAPERRRRERRPFCPKSYVFGIKPGPVRQLAETRSGKDKQLLRILVQVLVSLMICVLCHQWLRGGELGGAASGRS